MSNFADNYRYSQVAHESQLSHYGFPTGGVPRADKSSRGQVPQRRAVKASNQQGPYPSMPQTPARKPVGSRTASAAGSRAQSPAPLDRGGNSDLMKPLPSLPTPSTPRASESRPGSSSGWSFRGRKRTDSIASTGSSAVGQTRSRRGSISETVKEAGKWAKSKAGIVGMDPATRELWLQGAIKNQEREVEQARRQNPSSRPVSQQKLFAQKLDDSMDWSDITAQAMFNAHNEQRASREFRANGYKELHNKACADAYATGKPRPLTPEEAKLSPPRNSLNLQERIHARDTFGDGWDSEANPTLALSKSERFAMNLSRKLDTIKRNERGRKDSNSSAMDFADSAPAGSMFICSMCDMPQDSYLKEGKCDACHVWTKNKDSPPPPSMNRKKGHNPTSPEDDAKGGDLYICLPSQNRIRKVRETIYADPGNPFAVEEFDFSLLPSSTYVQNARGDADNGESWRYEDPEAAQTSHRMETLSILSDPFDLANVQNGLVSNRGTWSTFQSNRRSMSVHFGFLPILRTKDQDDMFGGEPIWSDRIPTLQIQHPSGTIFTMDTRRDTRFYDFYDDLLVEYGIEDSDHMARRSRR